LGRQWSGGAPDDFEPIEGIGKTFEKRLYDAGICTYETLAEITPEILADVCNAPAQFKPDYAKWIKQAKILAAKKAKSSKA
jgi:predicted flap endonuclease-1-like 5' DNA nuclease